MGCAESHEVHPYHPYQAISTTDFSDDSAPLSRLPSHLASRNMGHSVGREPPPVPPAAQRLASAAGPSSSAIATQHERLILELLPFKDAEQFREWVNGAFVRGSWDEFCRDFLAKNPGAPEPEKAKTADAARSALNSKNSKYMMYHPRKETWTPEDHHVRFIVTVISDNLLNNLWSSREWDKQSKDITKSVYEVLSFLRATAASPDPPSYED